MKKLVWQKKLINFPKLDKYTNKLIKKTFRLISRN